MSAHPLHGTIPAARCGSCPHYAPVGEIGQCSRCDCPRHTASPYGGHDPESPPGAEAALQVFSDLMEDARQELRKATDAEVEAELARDEARDALLLDPACLQPGVYDGVRVTVAQQNAWVAQRILKEERVLRKAKARRKDAEKYLEVVGRQGSIQQTITKSVGESYRGQRGVGW